MKKNSGWTLFEAMVLIFFIGVVLLMLGPIYWKGKEIIIEKRNLQLPENVLAQTIFVKEKGLLDGSDYIILEDKLTKARIFYYGGRMVVLPKEE